MCEYCGCRGVAPIAELMDEHAALVDQASHLRHDLATGDRPSALSRLGVLVADLERHVGREEDGIFRALRDAGEFLEEIELLEGEHRGFAAVVAGLDVDSPRLPEMLTRLLDDLADHVEREDLGIFPVSVVTLGAAGWATVDRAHAESPSFLLDTPTS
jgi:iron-sulfur cluster repair protein YtfE (RIC family)